MQFLVYILIVLATLGVAYGAYVLWEKRKKGHRGTLLGTTLFSVRVSQTKERGQQEEPQEEKISKAEQLYASFSSLRGGNFWHRFIYGRPRVVAEISNISEQNEIGFYIAVPKKKEEKFKSQIEGIYPDAVVEKKDEDYNIFHSQGNQAGSRLKLEKGNYFPVKTYKALKMDPLSQVTNALSKLSKAEGAAVQVVFRPTPKGWESRPQTIINKLQNGKSFSEAEEETKFSTTLIKELSFLLTPGAKKNSTSKAKEDLQIDEEKIEALQKKKEKQGFEVNIRMITSADEQKRADQLLSQLEGVWGQLSSSANSFEPSRVHGGSLEKLISDFSFRCFSNKGKMVLNSEELASIYHLSLGSLKTPVKSLKTERTAPPSILPEDGVLRLGRTVYRDQKQDVYFASREDRRRHFYLIGQTGTGKTSVLQEMVRQDIEAGEGVGVIDPHGDLTEEVLAYIPKERVEDIVLFEPFNMERPCGLNMLEYDTEEQKDFAVQEMISIFHKLFPPEIIGPMFEHYMRNAMLALMADQENPGTLVEIPRMFTDEDFLQKKLKKVEDPVVRDFWEKEWEQTQGQAKSEMLGYVVSKLGRFVENAMLRNIIGQRHSSFDLSEIMNEGKIFIANLSKGKTGEVNASLLGLILVTKIQMAAMKRADMPEEERRDFYLYMDEFQNFTTDSIATILSEARKYRLTLHMAHQYISQLEDEIREAVFGNVGTLAALRVGAEDGEVLETQFGPQFKKKDLVNMPNFNLALKMIINGQVADPFRIHTPKPQEGHPEIVSSIKEYSHSKYGRPREEVESKIKKRAQLSREKAKN